TGSLGNSYLAGSTNSDSY
ncbi:MAG: SBBP repeat-containing protein, partial [Planctomycetes bacterium]|nr:SBBP repeat-containing protein [Planctomycetota bacterium]